MAQYDVHRLDGGLVVNCQSDLLAHLSTRLIVPLSPREDAPVAAHRLNPVFALDGVDHTLLTQFAGAVEHHRLGSAVASLADHCFEITNALDTLISGV